MKTKSEENKNLQGLEGQEIDSKNIVGGTKQAWSDEHALTYHSNSIDEGGKKGFFKKGRLGGAQRTVQTDEK